MKRGIFILIVVALVAIAIYNNISQNEQAQDPQTSGSVGETAPAEEASSEALPEEGFKAPDFTLETLDGETLTLSQVGKPMMLNFWASWCPPCQAEAPDMARLYAKYGDKVEIVAVNLLTQDEVDKAREFVEEYGFTFPIPLDETGDVSMMYRVQGIPTSFYIDRNGTIIKKVVGIIPPEEMESLFRQLAGEE
ncbi:MAG: TlpA family protein disulfide reductase [Bacillaceae bacterium]|nr:TlpA family protein disulfide reductase [Bacillaceae bacterium]